MIERTEYLQRLMDFKDKNLIKVVTGIRRCGKSTLFELYQEELKKQGIPAQQIISINFEDMDYEELTDYKKLYQYIKVRLLPNKMTYIFLDEIQNVANFQKAVDSLYIKKNTDIYITGSNAYILSGELATLLSGRYVEISMLPLSFKEYLQAVPDNANPERSFKEYQLNSSFPGALELIGRKKIHEYLGGIYHTIILKDIVKRLNIADISMFESVTKFMFDNIGNLCSTKKIADTMTSYGRKISVHTVERYLNGLADSFILYKASRYDAKGKQYLRTGEKYYIADIGLRYYLLGSREADWGHILENIVFLELLRRGYEVYVGKVGNKEVDFIAMKESGYEYYQVSETVRDAATLKRELEPLNGISDHFPKYLLTMDIMPPISHNGIQQFNVIDWLVQKEM
ncbi:MAG: ATP-binding protein [Roseburia sp.]|nr:ATP-binding protein [Roseburia sp.]